MPSCFPATSALETACAGVCVQIITDNIRGDCSQWICSSSVCCVIRLAYGFVFYIILNYMVKFVMPSSLVLSETVIFILSGIPYLRTYLIYLFINKGSYIPLRFWVWLLSHRCCLSQQLVQVF